MHMFPLHLLTAILMDSRSGALANTTKKTPNVTKNSGRFSF